MIRLAVRCRPEQAEMVLAELTVLSPGGVEETAGDGYTEYAIYGAEGELPDIGEVEAASGDGLVEVVATEVADDWAERWRAFHKPLEISATDETGQPVGTSFWLRPPWEDVGPGQFEVVIDPGQAFGTGAHPTTRLSLELLLDLHDRGLSGGPLTDLGTGSAVLAIAAAKLGWGPVAGYDHEEAAIVAAIENAEVNAVGIELARLDLKAGLPDLAPTVVANLTAPLLEMVAGKMSPETRPERLVCSGLLERERERVESAFAGLGLVPEKFIAIEGWGGLLFEAS
ncbi:MAG TPA: 50S ribosomal protein L11 methyltransferase [Solirubrobacterales bacterium]|nr:50S ribosomal protein L11 methyltransferase [Solirubrobacterales bacterium]